MVKTSKKKAQKADDLSATQSLMARLAAMPHKPHSPVKGEANENPSVAQNKRWLFCSFGKWMVAVNSADLSVELHTVESAVPGRNEPHL